MIKHPLVSIIAGFTLWSLIFLMLYGVQATGCHLLGDERAPGGHGPLRIVLIGALLLSFLAVIIPYLAWQRQARHGQRDETADFTREVSGYVWLAAIIATPFCFGGVVWLTLCGT